MSIYFTLFVSYYYIFNAKKDVAEVLTKSIRNKLMIMDYRDAIISLDENSKNYFSKIIFLNNELKEEFNIGDLNQNYEIFLNIKINLFQDSLNKNKFGTLIFYFSPIGYIPFILITLIIEIIIFIFLYHRSISKIEKELSLKKMEYITTISQQVAHDIRSPLSALNILINEKIEISNDYKVLIQQVIDRINQIANDLLSESKINKKSLTKLENSKILHSSELSSLKNVINEIIIEKKILFSDYEFEFRNYNDCTIKKSDILEFK